MYQPETCPPLTATAPPLPTKSAASACLRECEARSGWYTARQSPLPSPITTRHSFLAELCAPCASITHSALTAPHLTLLRRCEHLLSASTIESDISRSVAAESWCMIPRPRAHQVPPRAPSCLARSTSRHLRSPVPLAAHPCLCLSPDRWLRCWACARRATVRDTGHNHGGMPSPTFWASETPRVPSSGHGDETIAPSSAAGRACPPPMVGSGRQCAQDEGRGCRACAATRVAPGVVLVVLRGLIIHHLQKQLIRLVKK